MKTHPVVSTTVYAARYLGLLIAHIFLKPKPASRNRSLEHIVLVVPGFLGPRSVLNPLQERLEAAGFETVSLNIGLYSLTFETATAALLWRIRMLRERNPGLKRIDIVAHSMGGLLALLALKSDALAGLECHLVTLGTPFLGTWAALLGCVLAPAALQMLPPFQEPTIIPGEDVFFLSIAGEFDPLAPPARCRHPQAVNIVIQTDHAGLLYDEKVSEQVLNFLKP